MAEKKWPANLILYNTEQPSTQWFQLAKQCFPRAKVIWDIDYESSLRISRMGYDCFFLPLGYSAPSTLFQKVELLPLNSKTECLSAEITNHSYLERPLSERPLDLLFLGHLSERRQKFLEIHAVKLKHFSVFMNADKLAGPLLPGITTPLDTTSSRGLAQRSKIQLNIHHGEDCYFEWHRIVLLGIAQRALVVSETCSMAPPFEPGRDFVMAPLEQIPERIEYYLKTRRGRAEAQIIVENAYKTLINHCQLSHALRPLVSYLGTPTIPEPRLFYSPQKDEISVAPQRSSICVVVQDILGETRAADSGVAQLALAETLAKHNHNVTLLHTQDQYTAERSLGYWTRWFAQRGIRFVALPESAATRIESSHAMVTSYLVYQWLKKNPFEIIHFPDQHGIAFYSLIAKRQGFAFEESLLIVHPHGPSSWHRQANREFLMSESELEDDYMERQSVASADIVVTSTAYIEEWLRSNSWTLPERVQPLPSIIKPENHPDSILPNKIREFVYVTSQRPGQGIEVFSKALKLMSPNELKGTTFSFASPSVSSQGYSSVELFSSELKRLGCDWRLLPKMNTESLFKYITRPGRFVLSLAPMHHFPQILRYCLAKQLPFLASRLGGVAELIHPEDLEHRLIEMNPKSLATALSTVTTRGFTSVRLSTTIVNAEKKWIDWHESILKQKPDKFKKTEWESNDLPLVSVCLCHYNRHELLEQALESLQLQDYPNYEVVLVDDGSDRVETLEYLSRLEPLFTEKNWKIVRQANRYLGAARNTAARTARGSYLLFMDDDNYAKPHEISTFMRVALRTDAEIVSSAMDVFEGNTPPDLDATPLGRWIFLGPVSDVGIFKNLFGDANSLYKKSTYEKIGGFTEDYGITHEDWEFMIKASLRGCRFETIPEPLFWYRKSPDSMIHTTSTYHNFRRTLRPYAQEFPAGLQPIIELVLGQFFRINEIKSQGKNVLLTVSLIKLLLAGIRKLRLAGQAELSDLFIEGTLESLQGANNPNLLYEFQISLGKICQDLGDNIKARRYYESALAIAQKFRANMFQTKAEELLCKLPKMSKPAN